jgi:hypothetical protein
MGRSRFGNGETFTGRLTTEDTEDTEIRLGRVSGSGSEPFPFWSGSVASVSSVVHSFGLRASAGRCIR